MAIKPNLKIRVAMFLIFEKKILNVFLSRLKKRLHGTHMDCSILIHIHHMNIHTHIHVYCCIYTYIPYCVHNMVHIYIHTHVCINYLVGALLDHILTEIHSGTVEVSFSTKSAAAARGRERWGWKNVHENETSPTFCRLHFENFYFIFNKTDQRR